MVVNFPPFTPPAPAHPPFPPPSPETPLSVDVQLTPWQGQFPQMFLTVTNRGPEQTFSGECRIVGHRNDPNPLLRKTYNLQWRYGGRELQLVRGKSDNLLIASAGDNSGPTLPGTLQWMRLEAASGEDGLYSQWGRGDNSQPEYDVEIKIFGDRSAQPQIECFTVRPGTTCALEMYQPSVQIDSPSHPAVCGKREIQVRGTVTIPRARIELRVFADRRWHHNGYWYAEGNSWVGTCWLGDTNATSGDYVIRAIANGSLDKNIKYTELPQSGYHSNDVKVQLQREITLRDLS